MSNMKKKRLTTTQIQYDELVDNIEPKRPILKNCIRAFHRRRYHMHNRSRLTSGFL